MGKAIQHLEKCEHLGGGGIWGEAHLSGQHLAQDNMLGAFYKSEQFINCAAHFINP